MIYNAIESLIRKAKYRMPHSVKNIINLLYYDSSLCQFQSKNVDHVVMNDCKFHPSDQLTSLVRPERAWFEGTRPDDIVLDIGAGIGSVAIPLAKKVARVYAIEPLYFPELNNNTILNGLTNVTINNCAIGPVQETRKISFGNKSLLVPVKTFSTVLNSIREKVNFLKIDIEGDEWSIRPSEVVGIREIRVEFHIRRGRAKQDRHTIAEWELELKMNGYNVTIHPDKHESSLQFKTVDYFLASKRDK